MPQEKTLVARQHEVKPKHEQHGDYEYFKHLIAPRQGNQCTVAIMEVPPLKSSYPYHYHVAVTEVFYIISGEGLLKTPDGEQSVAAGDVIVFPPGKAGSHKITNSSATETLRYLDMDTTAQADVAVYPDSGKVGLILNGVHGDDYRTDSAVDYYDGE